MVVAAAKRADPYQVGRHGLTADEIERYYQARGLCDLCDRRLPRGSRQWSIDHDHGHCAWVTGCPACVRGFLCSACNTFEGMIAKAIKRGWATGPAGRLAEYLADPPFQRWRRLGRPPRFG